MREIWKLIVAVFSSFLITLVVFPGLISEVQFCRIGNWAPVILVTVFSASDFTAKVSIVACFKAYTLFMLSWHYIALIPFANCKYVDVCNACMYEHIGQQI